MCGRVSGPASQNGRMSNPLRRRTLLGAGAAAVFGALLAACEGNDDDESADATLALFGGTVPADGPAIDLTPVVETAGRDVVMIGDSITVASTPGLEAAAERLGFTLTIYAEVGRRITVGRTPIAGTEVLEEALDDGLPDLVVVALGTNDIGKYATEEEYSAQIRQLLSLVPADAPIAWVNTYLRDQPDESARFNAALINVLGERGNATIARWSNIATEDGILSDGVHPTDDGTVEFTDLVSDEIANWLE